MLTKIHAGAVLVSNKFKNGRTSNLIICENPYLYDLDSFNILYRSLYPNFSFSNKEKRLNFDQSIKTNENAFVHKNAQIGKIVR